MNKGSKFWPLANSLSRREDCASSLLRILYWGWEPEKGGRSVLWIGQLLGSQGEEVLLSATRSVLSVGR